MSVEKRREAAHNGDHSIDYINPSVAANDESSDDENLGINANAVFHCPLVLSFLYFIMLLNWPLNSEVFVE